ncbi:MAG: hypothetical protein M3020_28035 [Myxococcota bacterium]|nr:hypothetical protein [Myxococcota bacterium]
MPRVARKLLLCLLLTAAKAQANGRFPETNQLVVEPGNPDHAVVRATFGLLVTRDHGASWQLVCEDAFGPQNTDPPLALLAGGVLVLGLEDGVSRSDALGCSFARAGGLPSDQRVRDVTASVGEPGTAWVLTADDAASRLWLSTDSGDSFDEAAVLAEASAVTLDVAPSNPDVVYVSGVTRDAGVLFRSRDRGARFEPFSIPGASGSKVPYIAAIDPTDENTVYVRTYGIPGALLQTRDGGESFSERPFEMPTPVQGFALSGDGSLLVASNPFDGTFRASRERFEFERVRCQGASCLGFAGDALLGCGSESLDGFVIGISRDRGATFSRLLAQSCMEGPVGCPQASGVASACATTWPELRARLGAERCEPVDVEPSTACFGESGAGGAGSDPELAGATGGEGDVPRAPTADASSGAGCGCRAAAPGGHPSFSACLLALMLARVARQRARAARS